MLDGFQLRFLAGVSILVGVIANLTASQIAAVTPGATPPAGPSPTRTPEVAEAERAL